MMKRLIAITFAGVIAMTSSSLYACDNNKTSKIDNDAKSAKKSVTTAASSGDKHVHGPSHKGLIDKWSDKNLGLSDTELKDGM